MDLAEDGQNFTKYISIIFDWKEISTFWLELHFILFQKVQQWLR